MSQPIQITIQLQESSNPLSLLEGLRDGLEQAITYLGEEAAKEDRFFGTDSEPQRPLPLGKSERPNADWEWPFGKHKGQKLKTIPSSYLEWCIKNMKPGPAIAKAKEFLGMS